MIYLFVTEGKKDVQIPLWSFQWNLTWYLFVQQVIVIY